MRRMVIGLTTATLLVAGLSAQNKPNFSGKWTRDDGATAAAAAAAMRGGQRPPGAGGTVGFICALTCTISHDANALKVERQQGDQTFKSEFKLDGTNSKNQAPGQGGMTDVITVAKWDGSRITFTTKREVGGATI